MTVLNDCPVCEMCPNESFSSHKNVRPLLIVKSEFLGYNTLKPYVPIIDGLLKIGPLLYPGG